MNLAQRYLATGMGLALLQLASGCTMECATHHGLEVIEFEASPDHIDPGDVTTLTWDVRGAQACEITRTLISGESDSFRVSPQGEATDDPADTAVYNLTCGNRHQLVTVSLVVTVGNTGAPSITSFSATPAQVVAGGSSMLSWSSEGASACDLTATPQGGQGFTISGLPTDSSLTLSPLWHTTDVRLNCYSDDGQATASLSIAVSSDGQPPPECDPASTDCPPPTPVPGCDPSTGNCPTPTPPPGCDASGANCPPPPCDPNSPDCPTPTPTPTCDPKQQNCPTPTPPPGCDASGANCPPPPCDPNSPDCPTPTPTPTCDPKQSDCPTPTPAPECDPTQSDCPTPEPTPIPPDGNPVISSFMAYPDSIALGDSTTLVWEAQNVVTCDLITYPSEGDTGSSEVGLPAAYKIQETPQATTEYVLTCHGKSSDAYAKLVVQVGGATPTPAPSPVINGFVASPSVIHLGESSTLAWKTEGVDTCDLAVVTADSNAPPLPGRTGLPANGSLSVSPVVSTAYTLTCHGQGPDATAAVKVAVQP